MYYQLLKVILTYAPGGYPALALLRGVWLLLQDRWKIMGSIHMKLYEKKPMAWAEMCADKIRVCCKHVLNLASMKSPYMTERLQSLIALVNPTKPKPISTTRSPKSTMDIDIKPNLRMRPHLARHPSESSCIICSSSCRCPECTTMVPPIQIDGDQDEEPIPVSDKGAARDDDSATLSETDVQAKKLKHNVPPQKGGHKKMADDAAGVMKKPAGEVMKKPVGKAATSKPVVCEVLKKRPASKSAKQMRVVRRLKPVGKAQTYILDAGGRFLVGCSVSRSSSHKKLITEIASELKIKTLTSEKAACKARLEELIAAA